MFEKILEFGLQRAELEWAQEPIYMAQIFLWVPLEVTRMRRILPLLRSHIHSTFPPVIDQIFCNSCVTHQIVLAEEQQHRRSHWSVPKHIDALFEKVHRVAFE